LECGIIGTNYPEMEMVYFGPTIRGGHSPDDRASISSTQKFLGIFEGNFSEYSGEELNF
jgi:dipeptidase D